MTDILKDLESYPDDPTVVMSRRLVGDVVAEIKRLRNELATANEANIDLRKAAAVFLDVMRAAQADLATERRDHEATKIEHSLAMKRAAEEAREAHINLAAAREESERLRWSCSAKDDVARKIAEIHRTNLAAKNENLRDMMFRAYQEGWNSSLSYVGEDDMIDAWEESAAKARIDAFLEGE